MSENAVTADEIVEWFFERYKDPANGVPFSSAEGGYQYVNGGPYDAREVLEQEFSDAPEALKDALREITDQNHEWVKKEDY